MAPGCKPGRREPYVGSNPTPCTRNARIKDKGERRKWKVFLLYPSAFILSRAGVAQLVERQPSKLNVASSSLVSRSKRVFCPSSSGVERILGKDEVSGSIPDLGSIGFSEFLRNK